MFKIDIWHTSDVIILVDSGSASLNTPCITMLLAYVPPGVNNISPLFRLKDFNISPFASSIISPISVPVDTNGAGNQNFSLKYGCIL